MLLQQRMVHLIPTTPLNWLTTITIITTIITTIIITTIIITTIITTIIITITITITTLIKITKVGLAVDLT